MRCRAATKDSLHALRLCSELDLVWAEPELWSFRGEVQFVSFKELLSWIIRHTQQLELFAVTVWSIWNQRNQARLNQPADAIHQITHLSKTWLVEFQARQVSQVSILIHTQPTRCRWKPPPLSCFKINFDRANFPKEKKSSIGVVIRDNRGLVIASCSNVVHQMLGSSDIETMAAMWALTFASNVGVRRAVLEGDSMAVITGLREDEKVLVPYRLLLEDAKFLSEQFDELLYSHTKREDNSLAHSLARYAIGIPDFLVWMEDVPSQLYSLKEITVALKEINWGLVDFNSLYSEVMAMVVDGYNEDMLATAFDHMRENKKAARRFLAKNAKLRKLWMDSYLLTRL
ncbi:uncharacterized protein LOC142616321 [Castanea sativa]|uniref:uncharacterized protein LOC142616321 n=1 Tax=Castanea sativa TaxID=21020 RepID=UPI003F64EBBF